MRGVGPALWEYPTLQKPSKALIEPKSPVSYPSEVRQRMSDSDFVAHPEWDVSDANIRKRYCGNATLNIEMTALSWLPGQSRPQILKPANVTC
jgi:hypothetical protein